MLTSVKRAETEKLDFPNKEELMRANKIEFKIFIPSTRDHDVIISKDAFNRRVNQAIRFLTKRFGGTTFDVESGTYQLKGKTIKERIAVIRVTTSKHIYNKYDEEVEKWIKSKKKSWGQKEIAFVYQGKMILV